MVNTVDVPVKSIQKALSLLDCLALGDFTRQGMSLSALATACDMPLNTARNLLKSMIACGYVTQLGHGVYLAGEKCVEICRVARLVDAATRQSLLAALQRFVDKEGEGCVYSVLVDGQRTIVASVDSTHAIRVSHATVEDSPFFAKPTGRMLAALADDRQLQRILQRHGLPGRHWGDIEDTATLSAALAKLRQDDLCEVETPSEGLYCLATSVPGSAGDWQGVVGTYAPSYRISAEHRVVLISGLRRLSREVSRIFKP